MRKQSLRLADIDTGLLPFLKTNKDATIWLNGNKVQGIYLFRECQYRISTDRGEFRYGLDTDLELEITT